MAGASRLPWDRRRPAGLEEIGPKARLRAPSSGWHFGARFEAGEVQGRSDGASFSWDRRHLAGLKEIGPKARPRGGAPRREAACALALRYPHRPAKQVPGDCSVLIRYADDLVIAFAEEKDARRVAEVLPKRLARFGLQLHPDKTRLVRFQIPRGEERPPQSNGPGAFTFLGFTHYWGKSRKGNWVVKRKTAASRLTRSLSRVRQWCRQRRHEPVPWQQRRLSLSLRGHYAYYGISGNYQALDNFYRQVTREWRKWLNRRSQKAGMSWERFNRLLATYPLPRPRIVHGVGVA